MSPTVQPTTVGGREQIRDGREPNRAKGLPRKVAKARGRKGVPC
jgi:hypothetical protein